MKVLHNLFLEELTDRYDGEKQLVQAMPKMIEAATCTHLKKFIQSHLKETEGHVTKLDSVFKAFGERPNGKQCQGILGLIKESNEIASSFKGSPAINAALISAAEKIEHYEIASYGCLHDWAMELGHEDAADMLQDILDEENDANRSLVELARTRSNIEAMAKDTADSCCTTKDGNRKDGSKVAPLAL